MKEKVVKDMVNVTPSVLNEMYAYTESENRYEAIICTSVIRRLKTLMSERKEVRKILYSPR